MEAGIARNCWKVVAPKPAECETTGLHGDSNQTFCFIYSLTKCMPRCSICSSTRSICKLARHDGDGRLLVLRMSLCFLPRLGLRNLRARTKATIVVPRFTGHGRSLLVPLNWPSCQAATKWRETYRQLFQDRSVPVRGTAPRKYYCAAKV